MGIKNKIESIDCIHSLGSNTFPEKLFKRGEEGCVLEFLRKYSASYYAIRDKSCAAGVFKFKVPKERVVKEIQEYSLFSINVSSFNYEKNQVLVGEIEILSNGEVYATLSMNPTYSV